LAKVIAEVEGLGGTVTSVSAGGLQALFGAPEANEDDPERAVRAAFRALSARPSVPGTKVPTLRVGVETGPAVVGPIGGGAKVEYGAVGDVVATAAALQLCNPDESGHSFRTNPDTEYGPIRTGGRLKADTPK
jgi:adenylate cyclase